MKLTPWFPISQKPTRVGVYQVADENYPEDKNLKWYSFWNGKRFGWFGETPDGAFKHKSMSTCCVVGEWRGIKNDA